MSFCLVKIDFGFLSRKIEIQEGSTTVIRFGLKSGRAFPSSTRELHCFINCTDYGTASKPGSLDADFSMSVANTNDIVLNEENDFQFSFFVKILEDLEKYNDDDETIIWHSVCFTDKEHNYPYELDPGQVIIEIKDTTIQTDPHFIQTVFGQDDDENQVSENICYNIYGRKGDVLILLNDTLLGNFPFFFHKN